MEWRHGTFQCPRCRFKVGCCEGETADAGLVVRKIPEGVRFAAAAGFSINAQAP